MLTIGIDPGLTGAIAFLNAHGELVAIEDVPTMEIPEAGPKATIKREVDVCALWDLLRRYVPADQTAQVVLEHASSVGAKTGEQAKASLAATKASIMAVIRLQGHAVRRVHPVTWKRLYGIREPAPGFGLPDSKKQALAIARGFYGTAYLALEKHHNRAEAALIARFGRREFS